MTVTVGFHRVKEARQVNLSSVPDDSLEFVSESGRLDIYVPPHVAEHTASAFNRAMQAVPDRDALDKGWTYQGKSGVWHIRCPMPLLYTAQHDEVTGENDPAWMFADGHDLIRLMDVIDDIEAEEMDDAKTDADVTLERAKE